MNVLRLAWRNVWRQRRRSLVTIGAMTFALWIMILYSGLVEGYLVGLRRNILDLELGDVQIHAMAYDTNPSLHTIVADAEAITAKLRDAGYPASARVLGGGLVAAGDQSSAASFRGIDVERDETVTKISEHVAAGAWLDASEPKGVVIGRRLARILGVDVGSELVVVSQGADGSMANDLYAVRGILKGISDVVDRSGVYMHATTLRELLVVPEGAHQILVRRPASTPLEVAKGEIEAIAGEHEVKTWREILPTLASMLDQTRGAMFAMFVIIYIAIGIVILNAMLMAVFERIREFGVLKALGVGPWGVMRIIWVESVMQTGLALAFGVLASLPALWYLQVKGIDLSRFGDMSVAGIAWDPVWKAEINAFTFAGPIVTLVVIVGLAVLYPAIKAAAIRPVEAMRYR